MTSEALQPQGTPTRRTVVAAVGAAGLAAALTACGSEDKSSSGSSTTQNGGDASGSSGGDGAAAGSGGTVLAKTSDIPEGGGKVFGSEGVVVTQPTKGEFKAFSSKCTHQGCAVNRIADGVISCPCHNSEFSATDGSVRKGPAVQPLPAKDIAVADGEIRLA
ncbi:Rieske (2Fe-2S) protein [Streptomyces kebangsaanensis]|uniref:Cytochrome bc1 complex Rieske iron-sulfur subunit n=1 Tax=Streptomyces kebangsaanensis TaxID=864058 RepID=A0ABW6L5E2_9ACTN|nr:Rieske (2Fe-2S) protein [Streptomyces kebangsaanensis]